MKTKKELKDAYKQMKFSMGVFQIRNVVNGKVFIGSSDNLDAIWNRHRTELNFGGHRNTTFQKEWKEFGEENFRFEILSEIEHREGEGIDYKKELTQLEKMFIEELQPYEEKGYHTLPKKK